MCAPNAATHTSSLQTSYTARVGSRVKQTSTDSSAVNAAMDLAPPISFTWASHVGMQRLAEIIASRLMFRDIHVDTSRVHITMNDLQMEVERYLDKQPQVLQAQYNWELPTEGRIREVLHHFCHTFEMATFQGEPEQWRLTHECREVDVEYPSGRLDDLDFWDTHVGTGLIRQEITYLLTLRGTPMTFDNLVGNIQTLFWILPRIIDLDDYPLVPTAVQMQNQLTLNTLEMFSQTHENPAMWTLTSLCTAWLWCE